MIVVGALLAFIGAIVAAAYAGAASSSYYKDEAQSAMTGAAVGVGILYTGVALILLGVTVVALVSSLKPLLLRR